MGLKVPTLYSYGSLYSLALGNLRAFQRHLIDIAKGTFMGLITWEIPRVLGALCQENVVTKYIFLFINYHITA